MSERIFIRSEALGQNQLNTGTQLLAEEDVRYSGLTNKPRLHPRLIIRKFRRTATQTNDLGDNQMLEFHNFILTDADEDVEEKYQITETFGPDFLFLYGPKPRVFTYSGVLYNTTEKPWVMEWQRAWDRSVPIVTSYPTDSGTDSQRGILSGTNVVINGGIARLEYDGSYGFARSIGGGTLIDPSGSGSPVGTNPNNVLSVREGYIIKLAIRRSGDRPNAASFQLVMLVTNRMDF